MFRKKINGFDEVIVHNTLWDLQRFLRDKVGLTETQANWSDREQPLELACNQVASVVLESQVMRANQDLDTYNPSAPGHLIVKGDSLREARADLAGKLHQAVSLDVEQLTEAISSTLAAAVLDPALQNLHMFKLVETVHDVLDAEAKLKTFALVNEAHAQLVAGVPYRPGWLSEDKADAFVSALAKAVRPHLPRRRKSKLGSAVAPVLPVVALPPKSPKHSEISSVLKNAQELYNATVTDVAGKYLRAMLGSAVSGQTIWRNDKQDRPSRTAGEILSDLNLIPKLEVDYKIADVVHPQALLCRELNLVAQVIEQQLDNGELADEVESLYRQRYARLYGADKTAPYSTTMHERAINTQVLPITRNICTTLNEFMIVTDGWQPTDRQEGPDLNPANQIRPAKRVLTMPHDVEYWDGEDVSVASSVPSPLAENSEAAADEAEDNDLDLGQIELADGDFDDEYGDLGDLQIAQTTVPTAQIAQAVATNVMADFTRLTTDHISWLQDSPVACVDKKEEDSRQISREAAVLLLESFSKSIHGRWVAVAQSGISDPGPVDPSTLRTQMCEQVRQSVFTQFETVSDEVASALRKSYLQDPTTNSQLLTEAGLQAIEDGCELAQDELLKIFRKLALGTPCNQNPAEAIGRDAAFQQQAVLLEMADEVRVSLGKLTKSLGNIEEHSEASVLAISANTMMIAHVDAVLNAACDPEGRGQLSGMQLTPLGIVPHPEAYDDRALATTDTALRIREVEVSLTAIWDSMMSGTLKTKIVSYYDECIREDMKAEPSKLTPYEYEGWVRDVQESLTDSIKLVGECARKSEQTIVGKFSISETATQVLLPTMRLQ